MGNGNDSDKVELARIELENQKVMRAFVRDQRLLDAGKWIGLIAVSWVPLQAVQPMVEDLAGKQTDVTAGLSISLVYSAVATLGWIVSAATSRSRRKSLVKLRARAGRMGFDLDVESSEEVGGE